MIETGYEVLPVLLSADEVAEVLGACEELLLLPPKDREPGDKVASGTLHLEDLHCRIEVVAALVDRPRVTELVERLLGDQHRVDQASFRSPQPGYGHQRLHADDVPKLSAGPSSAATMIVPLVDFTTTNGATRIIAGSHLRPDLQKESGRLEQHDDEVLLIAEAGAGLFFSGHLLHSGTTNESNAPRPALQLVWRRR